MQIQKHKQKIFMGIFVILFFCIYAFLAISSPTRFNAPDETASFFFASTFAENYELYFSEPLNSEVGGIMHPRSIGVYNSGLVPESFIGLMLIYGAVGSVVGIWVMVFLTPLLTVAASLCFYWIIKKVFTKKIAQISFVLFLMHPAIWYWTTRSMMPNMLFIDLLIFGLYILIRYWKTTWAYALGALLITMSVWVRMSELPWLGLAAICLYIPFIKEIKWYKVVLFCVTVVIAMTPVILMNKKTYTKWCLSGYTCLSNQIVAQERESVNVPDEFKVLMDVEVDKEIVETSTLSIWKDKVISFLFPFGIHEKLVVRNVWHYFISLFWWLTIPALMGIIGWYGIKENWKKKHIVYGSVTSVVSLWLFVYYGSWQVFDNINYWEVTIGNSYVRYWIPIFILLIPFIAYSFSLLLSHKKRIFQWFGIFIIALSVFLSFRITLWSSSESINSVDSALQTYSTHAKQVFSLTEENSVIVVERSDKIFFPNRRVVYNIYEDISVIPNLIKLVDLVPVYYYTYNTIEDMEHINKKYFIEYGVSFSLFTEINERITLYRLEKL